ncbi:hypothetical protein DIPPA_23167 [Diplonema papillatum]|nr:hypothetical protein DIPPA_23167 [Diplonema papillatum]KAJ9452552.1 hypothetical protein DIPPA_23167 [Diplonema papillatum]
MLLLNSARRAAMRILCPFDKFRVRVRITTREAGLLLNFAATPQSLLINAGTSASGLRGVCLYCQYKNAHHDMCEDVLRRLAIELRSAAPQCADQRRHRCFGDPSTPGVDDRSVPGALLRRQEHVRRQQQRASTSPASTKIASSSAAGPASDSGALSRSSASFVPGSAAAAATPRRMEYSSLPTRLPRLRRNCLNQRSEGILCSFIISWSSNTLSFV